MPQLFNKLPSSINIDGCEYEINTDFRVWIEIEKLLCSSRGNSFSAFAKCLALAYKTLPPSPSGALEGLLTFYSSGGQHTKGSSEDVSLAPPLYDFEADCEYIYSSFMSQYQIDLSKAQLHWWRFRALLWGLDENCKFARVISYRSTDTQSIKDPSLKSFYEKMKRLYSLPDNRTPDEKEAALSRSIECLF